MFEKQNSAKDQMCGARAVMNLPGEALMNLARGLRLVTRERR